MYNTETICTIHTTLISYSYSLISFLRLSLWFIDACRPRATGSGPRGTHSSLPLLLVIIVAATTTPPAPHLPLQPDHDHKRSSSPPFRQFHPHPPSKSSHPPHSTLSQLSPQPRDPDLAFQPPPLPDALPLPRLLLLDNHPELLGFILEFTEAGRIDQGGSFRAAVGGGFG